MEWTRTVQKIKKINSGTKSRHEGKAHIKNKIKQLKKVQKQTNNMDLSEKVKNCFSYPIMLL